MANCKGDVAGDHTSPTSAASSFSSLCHQASFTSSSMLRQSRCTSVTDVQLGLRKQVFCVLHRPSILAVQRCIDVCASPKSFSSYFHPLIVGGSGGSIKHWHGLPGLARLFTGLLSGCSGGICQDSSPSSSSTHCIR
jgi:hypothetical protein